MKYLLAYQISGQTVGTDIQSWSDADLNGNEPFKIVSSGSTIPNGYVNISGVENWHLFGGNVANDYLTIKNSIKELVAEKGWVSLSNTERDIVIEYYAYESATDAVMHVMITKGYTLNQAQLYLVQQWHRHHGKVVNACKQRWYYAKLIVPMYLQFSDGEDLFGAVESLAFAYNDMGKLGMNYGDKTNGIMDFIESTNAYVDNGLCERGYTVQIGTCDDFVRDLKEVLIDGIYSRYDDMFFN